MNIQQNSKSAYSAARVSARTGLLAAACLLAAVAMAVPEDAFARGGRGGGGGGRGGGGMARSSVSGASRGGGASASNRASGANRGNSGDRGGNRVNTGDRNTNIDRGDVNIDRGDVNIDVDPGYGNIRHPVAAGVIVGAAVGSAIAYGTMYSAVPYGCPIVHTYATPYYYCNDVYYEQQMEGDDVVYVVVDP